MNVAAIEEYIISHFNLLNDETKKRFERSEAGQEFRELVTKLFKAYTTYTESLGLWSLISGSKEAEKEKLKQLFSSAKNKYLEKVSQTQGYQTVIFSITTERLIKELPILKLLDLHQLKILSLTGSIKILFQKLDHIENQIAKEQEQLSRLDDWTKFKYGFINSKQIDNLMEQKKRILVDWEVKFSTNTVFPDFNETIRAKQRQKKVAQYQKVIADLARLLPILNYRPSTIALPINRQMMERFIARMNNFENTVTLTEELTEIYFNYMLEINKNEISFINLNSFNLVQAQRLADATLRALKAKKSLDFENWFNQYEDELSQYLENEFQLINGTQVAEPKLDLKKEMMNSLSFLWTNSVVQKTNNFVGRLAEAHAFIQATNFSTQNESSFLAILDIYNYGKYYDHIAETKTIIQSLLMPFNPLANEYKDIGLYEQNVFKKFLRILIPILIVVAAIIFLSLLLTPFILPELVFIAAVIPEIIIGLGVASLYVSVKNTLYQFARELFYGGPYQIPEFQVNERMTTAFGSKANALGVRAFYLDAISACDFLEKEYQDKQRHNTLTQEDIKNRKDNSYKRHRLCLEWYDIHSNKELGVDEVTKIVLKTLNQEINDKYKLLQSTLEEEREGIRASVKQVTSDLKDIFVQKGNPQPIIQTDPPIIKTNYKLGLFKPPVCLQHKIHAEQMVNLSQELSKLTLG